MLITGFFALMWLGELTFPDTIKLQNWRKISKRSTIIVSQDQYQFHLPCHKADQFFEGNTIIVKQKQQAKLVVASQPAALRTYKAFVSICQPW